MKTRGRLTGCRTRNMLAERRAWPVWWSERGVSNPIPSRTRPLTPQRLWYCVSRHGRVGHRQTCQARHTFPHSRLSRQSPPGSCPAGFVVFRGPPPPFTACPDAMKGPGQTQRHPSEASERLLRSARRHHSPLTACCILRRRPSCRHRNRRMAPCRRAFRSVPGGRVRSVSSLSPSRSWSPVSSSKAIRSMHRSRHRSCRPRRPAPAPEPGDDAPGHDRPRLTQGSP